MTIGLMAVLFLFSSCNNSVNSLFSEAKKSDDYMAVTVPKWIIKAGTKNIFENHLGTNDNTKKLISGIKKARVLVHNNKSEININKVHKIYDKLVNRKGFEEYLTVRDEGKVTSITVKEKGDKIKDLLLMTEGDEELVLLHIKTDISINDFEKGEYFKKLTK